MPNNTHSKGESLSLGRLAKHAIAETERLRRETGTTSAWFDPKTGLAKWDTPAGRNALIKFNRAIDTQAGYSDYCG